MNFSIFVHFHEILIFLLTINKKYVIIITVNKERKMIMEKTKTIKIRLYSEEDYASNSIDWLILTEEQFRLLEYLANNDCLADCIDYEVCNDADFITI